jgi:hypothetical protein
MRIDLRKIYYWNRRRDHAFLQTSDTTPFVPFYAFDSRETIVQLDYKVLKAAVEDVDEQEVKVACLLLCTMFGGKNSASWSLR